MKGYKICYKCKELKHISKFYSKENMCKICRNEIAKLHKEIKRKIGYYNSEKRICLICNEVFDKLELSSLNGHNYTTNPDDYILLCSSCHFLFDSLKHSRNNHKV